MLEGLEINLKSAKRDEDTWHNICNWPGSNLNDILPIGEKKSILVKICFFFFTPTVLCSDHLMLQQNYGTFKIVIFLLVLNFTMFYVIFTVGALK